MNLNQTLYFDHKLYLTHLSNLTSFLSLGTDLEFEEFNLTQIYQQFEIMVQVTSIFSSKC